MYDNFKDQEEISISYFAAVSAMAGAILNIHRRDEDSVDATISKDVKINNSIPAKSHLAFQLKSVYSKTRYRFSDSGDLIYSLKVKNYNDLVQKTNLKTYLAVMILPNDKKEWVQLDTEKLILKKCMYYICVEGKEISSNKNTVDVSIPKENILNDKSLLKLLDGVFKEESKNE